MIELFIIALLSLLVTLYVQARMAAREVRRNRENSGEADHHAVLKLRS